MRSPFKFACLPILFAATLLASCAATPGRITHKGDIAPWNATRGIALRGYDPVAYFDLGRPVQGNDAFAYQWEGVTWLFSSTAHRDQFRADPAHYAPQFGSYCSFAVSRGTVADVDPRHWAIVDDKLYLNNNAFAHKLWEQDRARNIAAGNINWPLLRKVPRAP